MDIINNTDKYASHRTITQNYFSIEVDENSFNPIIGCLTITAFNQFIIAFIINDHELLFFQKNKYKILDTISKTNKLYKFILNLIHSEKNIEKYIKEIEKIGDDNINKINKLFDLEILQKYLQIPSEISDEIYKNQKGGNFGYVIGIMIVIGATIYNFMGKKTTCVPPPPPPPPPNFTIERIPINNRGKCRILIINIAGIVRSKIIKITCDRRYFQPYFDEITMYNTLRASSGADLAEFTQGELIHANYNSGQYTANIDLDGVYYQFELSEIADNITLQTYWVHEMSIHAPISLRYIAGNYYTDIIDFMHFMRLSPTPALVQIINSVQHILTNINIAYNDVGFVHGDMKIDNILIETANGDTEARRSLIFDLDFSIAFRNTDYQELDNQLVNGYLQINPNGTNRIYKNFLHFFDIYLFNITLQSLIRVSAFRRIVEHINRLCNIDPLNIPNSFKYFVVIFWVTSNYEIYTTGYNHDLASFENIFNNFNNFRMSPDWVRLDVIGQETYHDIHAILHNQNTYST